VLGLSSILSIPASALPPSIANSIPQLIDSVVRMAITLKEDAEKGETGAAEGDGIRDDTLDDDDDEVGDVDQGFGEDEDVRNEVDESYRNALQGATSWDDDMAKFLLGGDWDEDREDVDEDFTSPLDRVDELLFLSDTLNAAFQREPEVRHHYVLAYHIFTLASAADPFPFYA
jgi:hypothetical protein